MLGDDVHRHEAFEAVADIYGADRLVAVIVGDRHGDAVEGGVAVDEADAAIAEGAGGAYGVAGEAAGDDIALLRGEVLVVVELGIDGAGLGKGEAFQTILEEGHAIDPDVDTVVAVARRGALGAVGGIDREVEAADDGEGVVDGAEGHGVVGEVELVVLLAAVDTAVAIDRQQTDAADRGGGMVLDLHAIGERVEDVEGAGVAHLVVEMGTAAHATVAGEGHDVALADRQHALGKGGVEGVGLLLTLDVIDEVADGAVVAVEVEIDGGDAAGMGNIEHLAARVGGDAQTDDVAVGRGIDRGADAVLAADAEVDAAMEMVGSDLAKGARRGGHEMEGEVEMGRAFGLRLDGQGGKEQKGKEERFLHRDGAFL